MPVIAAETSFLPEPKLRFGLGQAVEDPRDGLTLFGPLDEGRPLGLRLGVIGTDRGIEYFGAWLRRIQGFLVDKGSQVANPPFPGFQTIFRVPVAPGPVLTVSVPESDILSTVNLDDAHQRVFKTVGTFADRLMEASRDEEIEVDVWFVVIPDIVHTNCRPRSRIPSATRVKVAQRLTRRGALSFRRAPSLFPDLNALAVAYEYEVDFHNQLKARLLDRGLLTQIVRETTVAPPGVVQRASRDKSGLQAGVAWSLSTAAFYKAGFRPWKMDETRAGVCYIGLVFKRDETQADPRAACCAAQMFLDSGDGLVFRGAVGPWYSEEGEFHLSRKAARELIDMAVSAYDKRNGKPPEELFIHGRVSFSEDEWAGFRDAVDASRTNLVGIKIRDDTDLRLFRVGSHPVLRGTAWIRHRRGAYLWTKGYTPRLRTYVGREVPRPLRIDLVRGNADLQVVLADIMALTKLNYNTCILADGMPVTLRFADAVGEILTAAPNIGDNPLPFKHYI
jgi:hypothetical protein